jgi:hypothetical protein
MIKESQLKELIGHLVKTVLTELGTTDVMDTGVPVTSTSTSTSGTGAPAMTPVMQQKLEREKKKAADDKIKVDQKMLKKVSDDEKSLKRTYDLTRRYTKPNLKKQIDAEKKARMLGT